MPSENSATISCSSGCRLPVVDDRTTVLQCRVGVLFQTSPDGGSCLHSDALAFASVVMAVIDLPSVTP